MRRLLVAAVLAAILVPPGAEAHLGTANMGYHSRVTAIRPAEPGLDLRVLNRDDQLWLGNRTGRTIVVKGYGGEPYLRFTADAVFENKNSPAGYLNEDRYARSEVPKEASPTATPTWEKVADGDAYAWHDHRIHFMSPTPPKPVQDSPRRGHPIFRWKVPATADGKPFFVAGRLDYIPPKQPAFPVALIIALLGLIGAGMIGLLALRRVLIRSVEDGPRRTRVRHRNR